MCRQTQDKDEEVVMSKLKEEVEELEKDLRLQTEMNGIIVENCKIKTLFRSKSNGVFHLNIHLKICEESAIKIQYIFLCSCIA